MFYTLVSHAIRWHFAFYPIYWNRLFSDTKSTYDYETTKAQQVVNWAKSALFIVPTPIGIDASEEARRFWHSTTTLTGAANGGMTRIRKVIIHRCVNNDFSYNLSTEYLWSIDSSSRAARILYQKLMLKRAKIHWSMLFFL